MKRTLSILLAITMLFSICPVSVFAEGEENEELGIRNEEVLDESLNDNIEVIVDESSEDDAGIPEGDSEEPSVPDETAGEQEDESADEGELDEELPEDEELLDDEELPDDEDEEETDEEEEELETSGGDEMLVIYNGMYFDSEDVLSERPDILEDLEAIQASVENKPAETALGDGDENYAAYGDAEAADALREAMVKRNSSATLTVDNSAGEDALNLARNIVHMACMHTGVANEGDYITWEGLGVKYSKTEGTGTVTYVFAMTYLTNLVQENQVTAKVNELLSSFNYSGKTDYEKAFLAYNWLTENVKYTSRTDYPDWFNKEAHTAYAAFIYPDTYGAVCQGYAAAFYRLCLEMGVDCRVVRGTETTYGSSGGHAWNIACLNGTYYYFDATWDKGTDSSRYGYFADGSTHFNTEHSPYIFTGDSITLDDIDDDLYFAMLSTTADPGMYNISAEEYANAYAYITVSDSDVTYSGDSVTITAQAHNMTSAYSMYCTRSGSGSRASYTKSVAYDEDNNNFVITFAPDTESSVASGVDFFTLYLTKDETVTDETGVQTTTHTRIGQDITVNVSRSDGQTAVTGTYDYGGGNTKTVYLTYVADRGQYAFYVDSAAPVKEGYVLKWYTNSNGGSTVYPGSVIYTSTSITLTAKWQSATETWYFDANGGAVETTYKDVVYSQQFGELPTPTREGYSFLGWYTARSGGTQVNSETQVGRIQETMASNEGAKLTLYAHWIGKFEIDHSYVLMPSGQTFKLSATVDPAKYATNITWRAQKGSGDATDVITVDGSGTVTANTAGTAYVIASITINGTKYDSTVCKVVVSGATTVTCSLGSDGTFTASGTGNMPEPETPSQYEYVPWYDYMESIKKVVIEEGVTGIGACDFYGCTNLTEVSLPETLTKIGYRSFNGCTSLASIELPDSVTVIDEFAFNGCTGLESVKFSSGLTTIYQSAFLNCTSLKEVELPASLTTLSSWAFQNCTSLTSVTISGGLTELNSYLFQGCTSLTSVTIPNSVTKIGEFVFQGCTALKTIYIPSSVTTISAGDAFKSPFYGCSSDLVIYCGANEKQSGWAEKWNYYSDSDALTVKYTYSLDEYYCSLIDKNEENIVIPDCVTSIPQAAFNNCTKIKTITIPRSVTSIGESAFYGCSKLRSITIPSTVDSIGKNAFSGCNALTDVFYDGTQEHWNKITKGSGNECLTNATLHCNTFISGICGADISWGLDTDGVLTLSGTGAITENSAPSDAPWYNQSASITSVKIGYKIENIPKYAFYQYAITSVDIPLSVTTIGEQAFYGCSSLKSIVLPTALDSIGASAFYATGLVNVELPSQLTSLGAGAFGGCTALKTVYIPKSVTAIPGEDASGSPFYGSADSVVIYCEDSSKQSGWGEYWNYCSASSPAATEYGYSDEAYHYWVNLNSSATEIKLSSDKTAIPAYGLNNFSKLKSIIIPTSVASIGINAFTGCGALTDVFYAGTREQWNAIEKASGNDCLTNATLHCNTVANGTCGDNLRWAMDSEGSLTIYGTGAMTEFANEEAAPWHSYAGSIKKASIGDGATSIGQYAFYDCESMTAVTIPDSVASIGQYAFRGCKSLTGITIPSKVTVINNHTFAFCSSLTGVVIPASVTRIDEYAFFYCSALNDVYYGDSQQQWNLITIASNNDCLTKASLHCDIINSGTCGDNVFWMLDSAGTLTIFGTGDMYNYDFHYNTRTTAPWCNLKSKIKQIAINPGVTSIGDYAFYEFSGITGTLTIPDGVTSIGDRAFTSCNGLTGTLTIPESVTRIADWAFYNCTGLTGTLTIPENVTSIGERAFYLCSGFTGDLTIPGNVASIGECAFTHCTGFSGVLTISENVASIGEYAFYNCSGLTSVMMPKSVTSIGKNAFDECKAIADVYYAGTQAQWNAINIASGNECLTNKLHCNILAKGTCGENVVWMLDTEGTLTISGTGAMTDYTDPTTVPWWKDYHSSIKKIVIQDGVTSISSCAFCQTAATSVDIPASVQSIGNSAFAYCTALTSVIIPEGVTSIPNNLFAACTSLTNVTIPSTVTSIGNYAFHSCAALTSIDIPSGVKSIGANAFYGCKALTKVTIPAEVTEIGEYTFSECSSLTSLEIPDNVSKIGAYAFYGCTSLASITVPSGVTSIEDYTFHLCTSLASVSLPSTVTSIGKDAFSCCTSLTSISLPSGLTSIGNMAFWKSGLTGIAIPAGVTTIPENAFFGCTSLVDALLSEGTTTIGYQAFGDCSSLTSVTIPASVTTISSKAFLNCNALKTIYIPSSITTISTTEYSDSPFYMCSSDMVIYCGASSKQTGWGDYWNYYSKTGKLTVEYGYTWDEYFFETLDKNAEAIVIPDGMTSIPKKAFYNFTKLKSITIPDTVTSIGDYAFYGCTSLTDITIPASVTSLGNDVFNNCSSLAAITIPGTVASIGEDLFINCTSLSSVTIGSGITSIPDYMFSGCTSLASIELPGTVTSIGTAAFNKCSALKNIVIPNSVTKICAKAFFNCTALKTIYIPSSVATISTPDAYESPFYACSGDLVIYCEANAKQEGWGEYWNYCTYELALDTEYGYTGDTYNYWSTLDSTATEIEIPAGTTRIPANAFYNFKNLKSVTIPDGVASIGNNVFGGCTALKSIYIPESVTEISHTAAIDSPFYGCASSMVIYCGAVSAQEGWGEYWNYYNSNSALVARYGYTRDAYTAVIDIPSITLSQTYILMTKEDAPVTISATVEPAKLADNIVWRAESASGGKTDIITVSDSGTVTVNTDNKTGTAYVAAVITINGTEYTSARCRVVVADSDKTYLTSATLADTKATVEAYKTDYTRINVVLYSTAQDASTGNGLSSSGAALNSVEYTGAAIKSAWFNDPATAEMFELEPVDDRTLEIRPTEKASDPANAKLLKSTYKSSITVYADEQEYPCKTSDSKGTTQTLTITVKKSNPAVKISTVKLNSYIPGDSATLEFTNGAVNSFTVVSQPTWLDVDPETQSISLNSSVPTKSTSGKLVIDAKIAGWVEAKTQRITISVSASQTVPKLTFKPTSITVMPNTCDTATTAYTITPAQFADYEVSISRATEGKVNYTLDELSEWLEFTVANNEISVKALQSDTKDHTFKIFTKIGVAGSEKEYSFTVKLLKGTTTPTVTAKATGSIDTAIANSPITITTTLKNFNKGSGEIYSVAIEQYNSKTKTYTDVTDLFDTTGFSTSTGTGTITEATPGTIPSGYTYYAKVTLNTGAEDTVTSARVKLTVKWSKITSVKPSVSLKATSYIDVIRPNTAATITPTFKNWYSYTLNTENLVIYRNYSTKNQSDVVTDLFNVGISADGKSFVISAKDTANVSHKDKYTVMFKTTVDYNGNPDYELKATCTFTVKQGTAKFTANPTAVTLYALDPYSTGIVALSTTDGTLNSIKSVTLDTTSAKTFYIRSLGSGQYMLGLNDNVTVKAGQTKTVKLNVFLEGNNTATANTTVSVKINIK